VKKLRLARPSCMQGCGADDVTFMYHLPMSVALWHGSRAEPEREPQPALSLARPGLMLIVQRTPRNWSGPCEYQRAHPFGYSTHRCCTTASTQHSAQQRCTDDGHHHNVQHRLGHHHNVQHRLGTPRASIKNPPARLPGRLYCHISWAMRPTLPIPKLILSSSACHPCLRKDR
jgi:hypothetical protein